MAKQLINLGTTVNDGTGDALRVGAEKINDNFTELYDFLTGATGQLSFVSSILPGDGIEVSSTSGNILVSTKIATATELGTVKVGTGLAISQAGVLETTFTGDYSELVNAPNLSDYQLSATAFSGQYSDLEGAPAIPGSLVDLGITLGSLGQVLVMSAEGPVFGSAFDQSLNTVDSVAFSKLSLIADTSVTEELLASAIAQRDNYQNTTLPGLESQAENYQGLVGYWSNQMGLYSIGSPEFLEAQSQYYNFQGLLQSTISQISFVQGQLSSLNSQIMYYQSILSITTATLHFDHPSQSIVASNSLTTNAVDLGNSNLISAPAGIRISSSSDTVLLSGSNAWTFGDDGILNLPSNGGITCTGDIELSGSQRVSIVGTPFRFANLSRAERNAFNDPFPLDGSMIYNTTEKRFQLIQDGTINTLQTVIIDDPLSFLAQDLSTCGVDGVDAWSKDGLYNKSYTFYGTTNEIGSADADRVYFTYDSTKFSGGILEFEAEDIDTDLEAPTVVYNRYIGTVKFSHFNDGGTDKFVFKVDVDDTNNASNFNFAASIGIETIASSGGNVECVVLRFRQLASNPRTDSGGVQMGMKWKATMFSAVAETAVIYIGVGG